MDCLVDTNVWLRSLAITDPMKPVARRAIKLLLRRGVALCVTPQNLMEMWSVCTRPERDNGFGKTAAVTDRYCRFIESFVSVLPETPELFTKWRDLVVAHEVMGKKVFDARLVAAMSLHRVGRILTFNTKDFLRYKNIEAISPDNI
ncbi:putative nucleic acid-binding protein [Candidatus Sulfopaludibacter sp. SbA6]|nr:putative nucleic acid-binding protein [Candidatus Sulfopaludibacter sp. SbA6]